MNKESQTKPTTVMNIVKSLASLKLTVVCLVILTVLVIWGTVYQADHGLYQAQLKFFHSWVFFIFGFIPFPGTVSVMFVLLINLLFSLFFRIRFRFSNIGNIITHLGIVILLVGGGFTLYLAQESTLALREGETKNMSMSREQWELAVWERQGNQKKGQKVDARSFRTDQIITFSQFPFNIKVKTYFPNCGAFNAGGGDNVINASGIRNLSEQPLSSEAAENIAGGVFEIAGGTGTHPFILLYGGEERPTPLTIDGRTVFFSLRRKTINIPLHISLVDFKVKYYPNSTIPKSYESRVTIDDKKGLSREVVISMNRPLRYADYTFFQSSYFTGRDGSEHTILAVVKNSGRLLPYIASITIFLGMLIHFLVKLLRRKKAPTAAVVGVLVLLFMGTLGSYTAYAEVENLDSLKKVVILENGRKKPLETFAQNILKQFSGTSRYNKQSAINWLARAMFRPQESGDDKVFLITNPEVLDSMGVQRVGKARDRYSFNHLKPGLGKLRQLAFKASKIKANDRSFIENEIYTLYHKLYIYQQIIATFDFIYPHPDFTVKQAETRQLLQLPAQQENFNFMDMIASLGKMQAVMASLKDKTQEEWTPGQGEAVQLMRRINAWRNLYRDLPVAIIPSTEPAGPEIQEKWLSPWDILLPLLSVEQPVIPETLERMRDFGMAYINGDQQAFDTNIAAFNRLISKQAGDRIRLRAIDIEVLYNRIDPFYKCKFFYGFAVLFLLLSFIGFKKIFYRVSFGLLTIGFLLHLAGMLARMYIMNRPPVTNLYETFVFTGLITALLGMILEFYKKRNIGIFTGALAGFVMLMIAAKYAMEGDTMGMLVAVLDSNFWLAAHVITIILGYAGILLSGFLGHVYIFQQLFRPGKTEMLSNTFQAVYATQGFGIIFTFLGTVLGGIWADQSWGRFWGWDPKENGALLILLWSAILFHARMAGWLKEKNFAFGTVIGVICVALAWFGVNLLGVGLHSYGFTSGVANTLFAFIIFEVIFIFIGATILATRQKQ